MYRLILCAGICVCSLSVKAQDTINFSQAENSTYRFFTEQKWDSLVLTGEQALRQQIDYHYLRVRIGIAFFEMKRFRLAVLHLQKAIDFNSANETARQYLYLSLLYSERYEAAGKIARLIHDSTALLMRTNATPLPVITGVAAGKKFCSDTASGNASFGEAILNHRIGKDLSFVHAITYYYQPGTFNKVAQWEYYLGNNIPVGRNWLISPAVHFIFLNARIVIPYLDPAIKIPFIDTAIYATQTIASLAVKKSFPLFDAQLSGSWNNLYGASHTQESFGITFYPMFNNQLVLGTSLIANQDSLNLKSIFSYSALLSYRLSPLFSVQLNYYNGNSLYVNEYNGFLVNNSIDLTTSKISLMPSLYLSKHFKIYGLLQSEQKKRYNPGQTADSFRFHYITALTGVTYIF